MTWENNGRPGEPADKKWQMDHKKAKIHFDYQSMDDPEFIECWSLDNLKPIEARMNTIKSDRDLMQWCQSSFRKGILDPEYGGGVWKYLTYTASDARSKLEKNYGDKIAWENFGVNTLTIDHRVPQAYLSFSSLDDENFKKCWDLNNLQILLHQANSSKNSRYEGKLWFYLKE